MAKERFRDKVGLRKDNIDKLIRINDIIEEYSVQGYKLTLRQLYYQLVSRDMIPNVQKEYAKLSTLLVKGRMAGAVDWSAIEDRLRVPFLPYWAANAGDAIRDILRQYRLDRQKDQAVYVEVWVEKDALSGVLKRATTYYHVNLMVNRGYSSCTAIYNAYKRLERQRDKEAFILYLGDHDPSGLDMVRDVRERLEEFGGHPLVEHIAITKKQIEQYNPPPNPARITDPRAKWYLRQHGNVSWEVDALDPQVLDRLVTDSIENLIDMDKFGVQLEKEESDKEILQRIAEQTLPEKE